jgi:hypothetical protein
MLDSEAHYSEFRVMRLHINLECYVALDAS